MIPYIGDFAEDEEIYHYFNTFDSNDPAASVTITNLADTDIYVYKDGSITDIVTDGASVVIDFDGRTGVHKLTIDTSAHADYATGSDYMVLIEGTTVDGGTVTAGIFTFSIENRYMRGTDSAALASAYTSARAGYLDNINGHTAQTGDSYARIGAPAGASVSADVAAVKVDTAAVLVDTADMQPKMGTPAADLSADVAAVKAQTAAIEVDTQAIETDTQNIQSRLPAALAAGGSIKADITHVNTVAVTGDGQSGTEWGPA